LAVKKVTDNATLDLPDVIVREQAEELLADFRQSLEAQGGDFDAYMRATGTTVERMIEDLKPTAANNVKTGLVLDAVAKAEGLEATDEEVAMAIARMAAAGRVDAKTLEERLRDTGRIQAVRWQIVRDKAADFIAANAVPLSLGEAAIAEAKEALAGVSSLEAATGAAPATEATGKTTAPATEATGETTAAAAEAAAETTAAATEAAAETTTSAGEEEAETVALGSGATAVEAGETDAAEASGQTGAPEATPNE
jgi:trigger factor